MLNRMEPRGKKLYWYIRKSLFLKYLSEDVKGYKVLMLRQPAVKTVSTKLRFNNRRNRFRARPLNSDIGPPTSSAGSCQKDKSFVAITVTLLASKARSTEPGSPPGFFFARISSPSICVLVRPLAWFARFGAALIRRVIRSGRLLPFRRTGGHTLSNLRKLKT